MIAFLFALVVLGLVLYLVEQFIPMAPPFRIIIRALVALMLVWWLLYLVGLAPRMPM